MARKSKSTGELNREATWAKIAQVQIKGVRQVVRNTTHVALARLSSQADYTIFTFGDTSLKFAAPYSLRRYVRVKKWHDGYLEVDADYGHGIEEDYIDLKPVLRNLLINPKTFLKPIKNVEVCYA